MVQAFYTIIQILTINPSKLPSNSELATVVFELLSV